ncbi:MAG: TldD/PmbA family protein [Candidatus Aminicenantes bacterium]|jgi:PmbA protein
MDNVHVNLAAVAEDILKISKKHDCTAQITMIQNDAKDISLRNGEIEQLLTSVAISTGVRLFKGDKSTIIAFSGEDFDNMETKIKTALQNFEYLSDDQYIRLLTPEEFNSSHPLKALDLIDNGYDALDFKQIKKALQRIESGALAFSNKIIPSEMAEFSGSRSKIHLFTSDGVNKSYSKTLYMFSYTAVAEDKSKGLKEQDYWNERKRHFAALPSLENIGAIGEIAAEKAIKRLGGKKIKSGERKVIFSRRTASSLLSLLCDAVDGEEIVIKNSFLVDRLGEKLYPENITIVDDPFIEAYPGSYPFDGEGMNGKTKVIIEKGKLLTYLHNSYSAGKLNMNLTGNASHSISSPPHIKVGNFYLQGGQGSLDDLVRDMKEGVLVDGLFVSGINSVTGDFSFGCSGFLVENGKTTMPVKEITIAGNLLELYKNVVAIADDNLWKASITSPSILVSKLAVAGT